MMIKSEINAKRAQHKANMNKIMYEVNKSHAQHEVAVKNYIEAPL